MSADLEGGKYFFNTVKEGDQVVFATEDEAERTLWVQAIYRATGQAHKPVPPLSQQQQQQNKISNTQLSRMQGGLHYMSCYHVELFSVHDVPTLAISSHRC